MLKNWPSYLRIYAVCLYVLLVLVTAACVPMDAAPQNPAQNNKSAQDETLTEMLKLNDLNERAFAYHHYCLRETESMNPQFLKNFEIAINQLFDQALNTTDWEPQYIVDQVMDRRQYIQDTLRDYYQTQGCQSAEAITARDHYRALSR